MAVEIDSIIELQGTDGISYNCKVLGCFEIQLKDYVLLLLVNGAEDAGKDGAVVLMQILEKNGATIFRMIEDTAEFERVAAYIKDLAAGA